jgi:hypothetical protein
VAQLVFENGFSLALQADRVMFLEAIGEKAMADTTIAEVTCKYVEASTFAAISATALTAMLPLILSTPKYWLLVNGRSLLTNLSRLQ